MDFPRADILRPSALVIAIAESIAFNLPPCDETASCAFLVVVRRLS
jgi:hypothetical protein